MTLGPIQILVVGFARDDFTGKILPKLRDLDQKGFIRIIDLLFARKDIKGKIFALKDNELTSEEVVRFGAISGTLIGLGISDDEASGSATVTGYSASAEKMFESNVKEIVDVIEKIPKNSSFAVVLIEQLWTIELRKSITKEGGVLLAQGQVSPLALVNIEAEMVAALKASEKKVG